MAGEIKVVRYRIYAWNVSRASMRPPRNGGGNWVGHAVFRSRTRYGRFNEAPAQWRGKPTSGQHVRLDLRYSPLQ